MTLKFSMARWFYFKVRNDFFLGAPGDLILVMFVRVAWGQTTKKPRYAALINLTAFCTSSLAECHSGNSFSELKNKSTLHYKRKSSISRFTRISSTCRRSAEQMMDGRHQRVDIAAHARTVDNGLLQKWLEEDLCWIVPHVPPPPRRPNWSRDWTELQRT